MTKDPRGTKRHCHSCNATFYDLNRGPIVCPMCGTEFDPEVLLKSRKAKPVAQEAVEEQKPAPAAEEGEAAAAVVEPDIEEAGGDAEEDVLEDGDEVIKVTPDSDESDEESLIATGDEVVVEDGLDPGEPEDSEDTEDPEEREGREG